MFVETQLLTDRMDLAFRKMKHSQQENNVNQTFKLMCRNLVIELYQFPLRTHLHLISLA